MVLVLDDNANPAFGTSQLLVEHHGLKVSQLRIVQCETDKANEMKAHRKFGSLVVEGYVQDHLKDEQYADEFYDGVYLDLCGSWDKQLKPALEALMFKCKKASVSMSFVLGVTWCTRNPYGQTTDASVAELYRLLSEQASVLVRYIKMDLDLCKHTSLRLR